MKLSEFTGDMEVIQKLATFPNADDGLTAEQLKAKFDQAPAALKEYINNTLVPAVRKLQSKGGSLVVTVADGVADKSLAEVLAAAEEQRHVVLLFGEMRLGLIHADESGAIFTAVADGQMTAKVVMDADGMLSEQTFRLASKIDVSKVAEDAKTLRVNVSITDYAEDGTGTGFGLADKTLAEIAAAVNFGRSVCAVDDEGIIYSLVQSDSEIATFLMNLADVVYVLSVFEEGVMREAYPLVTPEQIPTKVSQLDNDSGFITGYTETDPTVPSWAKQANKPSYTASEVGALPNTTKIPSKTSDLTNDSGYITGYTETDPTVPAWAKAASKPSYSKSEVGLGNVDNVKQYSASNPPPYPVTSVNGKTGAVTITVPTVPTKVSAFENDKGYLTQHQDISGKLDASALPTAINTALAQAKASGEFDGKDGYTPVKGVDYFDGAPGKDGVDGKDYSFDPTAYGLPILHLTGDISPIKVSKDNKVTLTYVYGERSGTCTLKGQGATSYKTAKALVDAGKAGKFNYTIKFDNAFEAKEGWGAQQKYCLKANFIDTTHSRNIVSCKLWGMSVKARSAVPSQLANLPNGGAIDGFPIIIMLNGEFHGLYTWNIPKDGWMFGLVEDTTKTQALVGANDHELATQFKGELAGDESDFELEFVSNENSTAWVSESLNRLINACIDSDGSDLDSTVAQYVDWDSAIDYFVHCVVDKATDCVDKNFLLVTFDGVKWYFSAYDRDSIHGLNWDASGTTRPVSNISFAECKETSRMWELIYRFKTDALKARYWELRENILSESRIMQTFENFAWNIPSPVLVEDVKRYPTILGSSVNTIDQIGRFVRQRLDVCDAWVNALPAQESTGGGSAATTYAVTNNLSNCVSSNSGSSVNADSAYNATITANDGYTLDGASVSITMGGTDITSAAYSNGVISIASVTGAVVVAIAAVKKASGYTNLVPASTDADGNIYNDTGYMDDVRLSSSGTVSSTAQAGSATTGFMPYSDLGIIRVKGATWLDTTGHYYVAFYDSDKALLYAVSRSGYDDGNVRGAVITYDDATGVTTFDFSGTSDTSEVGDAIRKAVYFRLNAYGKGADLIVTVNEEIT